MPPIRTQNPGPRSHHDLCMAGSRDILNSLSSSCDTRDTDGDSNPNRDSNLNGESSAASPVSTSEVPEGESITNILPDGRRANAFFDDLSDSDLHRTFLPRYMKTNICDQCNMRNKSVMQRCTRCNMHFCKLCTRAVDDGKHIFKGAALDWSRPEVMIYDKAPKKAIVSKRAKKTPAVGSRNRVEKNTKAKTASTTAMNRTPRVRFVDRPAAELIFEPRRPLVSAETPELEENSLFIDDGSYIEDEDEDEFEEDQPRKASTLKASPAPESSHEANNAPLRSRPQKPQPAPQSPYKDQLPTHPLLTHQPGTTNNHTATPKPPPTTNPNTNHRFHHPHHPHHYLISPLTAPPFPSPSPSSRCPALLRLSMHEQIERARIRQLHASEEMLAGARALMKLHRS